MNPKEIIQKTMKKNPAAIPFALFYVAGMLLIMSTPFVIAKKSPFFDYGGAVKKAEGLILYHNQNCSFEDFKERRYLVADAIERGWTEDQLITVVKEQNYNKLKMYQEAVSQAWTPRQVEQLFRN
jgi:hypothetical protein